MLPGRPVKRKMTAGEFFFKKKIVCQRYRYPIALKVWQLEAGTSKKGGIGSRT